MLIFGVCHSWFRKSRPTSQFSGQSHKLCKTYRVFTQSGFVQFKHSNHLLILVVHCNV